MLPTRPCSNGSLDTVTDFTSDWTDVDLGSLKEQVEQIEARIQSVQEETATATVRIQVLEQANKERESLLEDLKEQHDDLLLKLITHCLDRIEDALADLSDGLELIDRVVARAKLRKREQEESEDSEGKKKRKKRNYARNYNKFRFDELLQKNRVGC